MSIMSDTTAVDFAAGLRRLADLLDEHPHLKVSYNYYRHLICVDSAERMATIIRALGGRWEKGSASDDYFGMTRELGDGVSLHVFALRAAVCERIVVGRRTVQRVVIPDNAPTEEVEEEIVEWRCAPSVLAAGGEQ